MKERLEWEKTRGIRKTIFQVSNDWCLYWGSGSWQGMVGSFKRTEAGKGWDAKRGANVAVLPRALGTHCSSLRKETPCLITDDCRGGTA